MDRGAWRTTDHGVAKDSDTTEQLSTHAHKYWLCKNKKGPQAEECGQPRNAKGQRIDSILDLSEERQFANTLILAH